MRLINARTQKFEDFHDARSVSYAVLSHTWREDEVLYRVFLDGTGKGKKGYRKIMYLCKQTLLHGLNYCWIDTACIDKSNIAELSEAINSMFNWYQNSTVCYVYLDDVVKSAEIPTSRWITRGWTLQELDAPPSLFFYNHQWDLLGSKKALAADLSEWTHIEEIFLIDSQHVKDTSVANRMLWAAGRETTCIEDKTYCLSGILDVNFPLLYGEGEGAFLRLQELISEQKNDWSILVRRNSDIHGYDTSLYMNKNGLGLNLMIRGNGRNRALNLGYGILNCWRKESMDNLISNLLYLKGEDSSTWWRFPVIAVVKANLDWLEEAVMSEIIVSRHTVSPTEGRGDPWEKCQIWIPLWVLISVSVCWAGVGGLILMSCVT